MEILESVFKDYFHSGSLRANDILLNYVNKSSRETDWRECSGAASCRTTWNGAKSTFRVQRMASW